MSHLPQKNQTSEYQETLELQNGYWNVSKNFYIDHSNKKKIRL